MRSDFQRAFIRPETRVFGLELQPLTVGHLLHLFRSDLPPFASAGPAELLQAVFYCSQPWRDSERDKNKWWARLFCRFWWSRVKRMKYLDHLAAFNDYITDGLYIPQTKHDPQTARTVESPSPVRLLAAGMAYFGMSYDEVLDAPVKELCAIYIAYMEMEGRAELWTEDDEQLWLAAQGRNN
jgi:hypothetical protein